MKKFRLYSVAFLSDNDRLDTIWDDVEATSYAEVIQEIESNAGWYTDINGAFKVAYIEEVVE